MKYNVKVVSSGHEYDGQIDITITDNRVSGTITTKEYGVGQISNSFVDGASISGHIDIAGYDAHFDATIEGDTITGHLKYGWFFSADFTGTKEI